MREAGNAYSSGAPGSTSFARSSLLYLVFTGWFLIFYLCCLFNDLLHRITILDLSAGTFAYPNTTINPKKIDPWPSPSNAHSMTNKGLGLGLGLWLRLGLGLGLGFRV